MKAKKDLIFGYGCCYASHACWQVATIMFMMVRMRVVCQYRSLGRMKLTKVRK